MAKRFKKQGGIVYSTNPDFYHGENENEIKEQETLPPEEQQLYISLDKKQRRGKTVTLITGFEGKDEDLKTLGKLLKAKCGTGGSVKDNEIIIQGDFKQKIKMILEQTGYFCKIIG